MRAKAKGMSALPLMLPSVCLVVFVSLGCSPTSQPTELESSVRPVGQQNQVEPLEEPAMLSGRLEKQSDASSAPNGESGIPATPADSPEDDLNTTTEESVPSDELALADVPEIEPAKPAIPATAKNWPLFRGDSHSSGVAVSTLPEKLELLWKFRVEDGGFETTPAIVDGVAYVGDFDGKLFAVDVKSGDKLWEFAGELGFVASPAVFKGNVYIGDLDGKFYCINAKTGKKIWDFTAEAQIDSAANFYRDNVLVGSQDATLYCLKASDGKPVWKFTIDDQIRCTPTIVDNRCFLAGCDGKLHIVDLDKGEAVADVPIESPTGTTPAVLGNRVYFGTHAGDFFCIDWKEAKTIWTWQHEDDPSEFRSSAAVMKSHVIVGDRGRRLFALNPESGERIWNFPTKRNVDSSPVIVGDRVFFGSGDGIVFALDVKTGEEKWKYEAGGGFIGSPAVADEKLFIASEDGILYCFGAKE